jgi:hypothetical protein
MGSRFLMPSSDSLPYCRGTKPNRLAAHLAKRTVVAARFRPTPGEASLQ